jgi:hypothetical protein
MTPRRKPTNLTLSEEALRLAGELMDAETRPSLSNLVEALVVREHQRLAAAGGKTKAPSAEQKAEVAA